MAEMSPHRKFSDILDEIYPPGTSKREEYDRYSREYNKRQSRLDRIFGWMIHIPPKFPADKDEHGYDHNHWKGLGPLMFLVYRTWVDEGFYGMLDMLSFHYANDAYVITFKDIRKMRHGHSAQKSLIRQREE